MQAYDAWVDGPSEIPHKGEGRFTRYRSQGQNETDRTISPNQTTGRVNLG